MAHSHVQRLLREGMELDELEQDGDGDYAFRHGTAAYFLSVHPDGHAVRIWSHAVQGTKATAPVLREVNDANRRLVQSRAYVDGPTLVVECIVPVKPLTVAHLMGACHEVACTADRLGSLVAAVHGGQVWFDQEVEEATG